MTINSDKFDGEKILTAGLSNGHLITFKKSDETQLRDIGSCSESYLDLNFTYLNVVKGANFVKENSSTE